MAVFLKKKKKAAVLISVCLEEMGTVEKKAVGGIEGHVFGQGHLSAGTSTPYLIQSSYSFK